MTCDVCGNLRHVRQADGSIARCACFFPAFDERFIVPGIRGRAPRYPDALDQLPPWGLDESRLVGGPLAKFKAMVWRSLAPHRFSGVQYRFHTFPEVVDACFERASVPKAAIFETPLLILTLSSSTVRSEFASAVLLQILERAEHRGLTNWIHSTLPPARIGADFSPDVQDLLPPYSREAY